jgi:hypothetical protein
MVGGESIVAGLEKADLKKMLRMSQKRGPMNMAFAIGGDGKAIIQIEKIKQPRAIERILKTDAPDSKNHRFGTVFVDPDQPKLAQFIVNKASGGIARKLIIQLKGTGFSKVRLLTEDGGVCEEDEGEEENVADDDDDDFDDYDETSEHRETVSAKSSQKEPEASSLPQTTAPAEPDDRDLDAKSPGADSQADAEDAGGLLDARALTSELTELVKQMLAVIAADPSRKAALAELATDAQAGLKSGDLRQASAAIDVLRAALSSAGNTSAQPSPDAAAETAPTPTIDPAAAPTITKARTVWVATRQKIEGDLGKLHAKFSTAFKGHEQEEQISKAFRERVETVLNTLDEELSETLDAVNNAKDTNERARLVAQAHTLLKKYQQHLATDPTIAALDTNPFVPLAVGKTMSATIDALSRSIR